MFSFFRRKKIKNDDSEFEEYTSEVINDFSENDFLGKAAIAKRKAISAIKNKKYDIAWGLFHEQKENFMKHAVRSEFSQRQIFALDSSVSEIFANILRLEGRHHEALVHIIYWIACSDKQTKRQHEKLIAYFNRAKLKNVEYSVVEGFIESMKRDPDFRVIQNNVKGWSEKSSV